MQLSSVVQTSPVRESLRASPGESRHFGGRRLAKVVFLSLLLSSVADHALAHWLGLSRNPPWTRANAVYRRIGPQSGSQVFCAGSSLLVSGLGWPEVSESVGRGIETWTVAGSSPEVWEVFQQQKLVSDTTIIGISIYDLNEMRITPERASFVPLRVTLADLWSSRTDPDLRQRILAQYAMSYIRVLYPTAGDANKVLAGLRSKVANLLGRQASLEQYEGIVVEKEGVLDVEEETTSVTDWSSGHVLRRLDALRAENHGAHDFDGPKNRAFRRMLVRAQQQGRLTIVALPVSQHYVDAFLDKATVAAFEKALSDSVAAVPRATLVRLDQVPGISDNKNFFDLVHLNSAGRRMLTPVFLKELNERTSKPKPYSSLDKPVTY